MTIEINTSLVGKSYGSNNSVAESNSSNKSEAINCYYIKGSPLVATRIIHNKLSKDVKGINLRSKIIQSCQKYCLRSSKVFFGTTYNLPFFCSESDSVNTIPRNDKVRYDCSELPWGPSTIGIIGKDTIIVHGAGVTESDERPARDSSTASHMDPKGGSMESPSSPQRETSSAHVPHHTNVVFVALGQRFSGPGGQSYVTHAIRQWRRFHPTSMSTIHLIIDKKVAAESTEVRALAEEMARHDHKGEAKGSSSFRIHYEQDLVSRKYKQYLSVFYVQGMMHPGGGKKTGNQNFNSHVSGRFYALEELMRRLNLTHVIHLEGDIMIYDNMLPIVQSLARCQYEMASTVIDSSGVIPSILYIAKLPLMSPLGYVGRL